MVGVKAGEAAATASSPHTSVQKGELPAAKSCSLHPSTWKLQYPGEFQIGTLCGIPEPLHHASRRCQDPWACLLVSISEVARAALQAYDA